MTKKDLKIWIAVLIPFAFCVSLLFPAVRHFVIIAVERVIFHRDLRDDKWLRVLFFAGITGAVVISFYALQNLNMPFVFKKRLSPPKLSFLQEPVSPKSFFNFIKQNRLLLVSLIVLTLFTYGIALFEYSIGIDTELLINSDDKSGRWSIGRGRFAYVFLQKIWDVKEFNRYAAVFGTLVLIVFSALSWSYMLVVFSQKNIEQKRLFVFALPFSVALPWAMQLSFSFQSREIMFGVFIIPFIIYLLFTGFLDRAPLKAAAGTLLLCFIPALYQSLLPLFCAGVFAAFILLQENTGFHKKVYSKLVIQLAISLAAACALYFILWKAVLFILHWGLSRQVGNSIMWGKIPFKSIVISLLKSSVALFINNRETGLAPLLPLSLLFIVQIITNAVRNKIQHDRKLFYCLAGAFIPLSLFFMPVILGGGGDRAV